MSTINSVTAAAYTTTAYESKAAAKKENTEATTEKSYGKDVGVVYEKSSKTVENAGTYKKTSGKTNTALIEKMKADITAIAREYITLEGDGNYEKATQLIQEKGIVSPALQKDLDKIANAGIPKDIFFKQGAEVLGLN